jgi:hypothetical protein
MAAANALGLLVGPSLCDLVAHEMQEHLDMAVRGGREVRGCTADGEQSIVSNAAATGLTLLCRVQEGIRH